MKVFLDTNIILDFLDIKRPTHQEAEKIVQFLVANNIGVFLSEDMITTIYYISKNKMQVLEFFTTVSRLWNVVSFGQTVIHEAIKVCQQNNTIDFEDTLQCLCAKANECTVLITNDKAFYRCGIDVVTSNEFLASLNSKK
ncbi:MAG: type II toxin-antitoxin system VapC family toxin [Sulfuricurvum sp.]|nr:type II toxin-antitoxin system VapC family toxin [Sulfuricurvum sp.]